jgi:hypothetical protein
MKLNFLNIRTNNQLKKNKSLRSSIPYKQALTVGVLFTVEDKKKHDDIKEFIHKLEQDGKKVQVLEYLPVKKDNYEFMFDFFTIKDISFWGKIESEKTLKFSDTPFDYLFCMDTERNPMVLYLLARSKAKCRVGRFQDQEKSFFELMIDSNGGTKNLIDGIYKYTAQLK